MILLTVKLLSFKVKLASFVMIIIALCVSNQIRASVHNVLDLIKLLMEFAKPFVLFQDAINVLVILVSVALNHFTI